MRRNERVLGGMEAGSALRMCRFSQSMKKRGKQVPADGLRHTVLVSAWEIVVGWNGQWISRESMSDILEANTKDGVRKEG